MDELSGLSPDLHNFYRSIFTRWFRDVSEYERNYWPLLAAIAVAPTPLPEDIIMNLLDCERKQGMRRLERIGQLLEQRPRGCTFFHTSLAAWLLDHSHSGDYWCDPREGHRVLADYGWQRYQQGVDSLSEYMVAHLPHHLIAIQRWDAVTDLLTSEAYVTRIEESEGAGAHHAIAVFMEAVSSLPADHRGALWAGPHPSATLALKGTGALVDLGRLNVAEELAAEARGHVEVRSEPDLRVRWLLLSARLHLNAGALDQAEDEATRALRLARSAGFEEGVAKALLNIGVILRRSKDRSDTAHEALLGALQQDFSDQDADLRARVHLNLAMVYTLRGERQQAEEALEQASNEIQETDNPLLEAWLWKYGGFVGLLSDREAASERFLQAATRFAEAGNRQEAEASGLLAVFSKGDLISQRLQKLLKTARRSGDVSADVLERAEASLRELDGLLATAVPAEAEAEVASQILRKAVDAALALERQAGHIVRPVPPATTMGFVRWLEEQFDPNPPMGLRSPTETALSIGMVVGNRDGSSEFCPIIENGTPYPAYGTRHFFLWHGREVVLPIYASDKTEPVIEDLVELGRLTVDCSEEDTVVVEMEMHSDRLLSVTASCHHCRDSVEIPLGR